MKENRSPITQVLALLCLTVFALCVLLVLLTAFGIQLYRLQGQMTEAQTQAAQLTQDLDLTPAQCRTLFQALRQEISTLEKLAEPAPAALPLKGFDLLYGNGETVAALAYDREEKAHE